MTFEELKQKMDEAHYIYDETLATVLYVALQLGRPLLIEGAAGVGKTEIAKVMASALDRDLVRLQCYKQHGCPSLIVNIMGFVHFLFQFFKCHNTALLFGMIIS